MPTSLRRQPNGCYRSHPDRDPGLSFVPYRESQRQKKLDRAQVVRAALALLDEVGLDDLTMRRLADRLGIKAASLYRHVRDKDELLALLADEISGEVPMVESRGSWKDQLVEMGRNTRRGLLAHRDGARLLPSRRLPSGHHDGKCLPRPASTSALCPRTSTRTSSRWLPTWPRMMPTGCSSSDCRSGCARSSNFRARRGGARDESRGRSGSDGRCSAFLANCGELRSPGPKNQIRPHFAEIALRDTRP